MISEGDGCRLGPAPVRIEEPRRVAMVEPEAVAAMLRLKELGWGSKRIAREDDCRIKYCAGYMLRAACGEIES